MQTNPTPSIAPSRPLARMPKNAANAPTVPKHSVHETGNASIPASRSILPSGPSASAFADSASRLPSSYNARSDARASLSSALCRNLKDRAVHATAAAAKSTPKANAPEKNPFMAIAFLRPEKP